MMGPARRSVFHAENCVKKLRVDTASPWLSLVSIGLKSFNVIDCHVERLELAITEVIKKTCPVF